MDTYDQDALAAAAEGPQQPLCAGCETPLFEKTGRTPLCSDCRERFIRYPVPNWIKIFGGAVLLLLVYGLTRLPSGLSAAIHHERGVRAMTAHNYATAQRELQQAVDMQPNYLEANIHLFMAAYYNEDYQKAALVSQKLEGRKVEDDELFQTATDVMGRLGNVFPSDSLQAFLEAHPEGAVEIPESAWAAYQQDHPHEFLADFAHAAAANNRKDYPLAEALLRSTLETDPENTRSLQMMIGIKRERLQFDSALFYADKLLAINHEIAASYGTKARVLLKQKRDADAYRIVQQGLKLDAHDGYCLATLALVQHYRGDIRSRDALIGQSAHDSLLQPHFAYVTDIVSGKESFRN